MAEAPHPDGGWESSAPAWIRHVDESDVNRKQLLDPVMLRELGDVRGKRVCDVGCGEGRFCRMMRDLGAYVVGVDPTPALVDAAVSRDARGRYVMAEAARLPLASTSFNSVVSYITLVDIADFRQAIHEMARILQPGGDLLIATMSPWASANGVGWTRGPDGERLYYGIDCYLEERAIEVAWSGIEITNYHRPLSAYMSALLGVGLALESFVEPAFSAEQVRARPDLHYDNRVPNFLVMRWRKSCAPAA